MVRLRRGFSYTKQIILDSFKIRHRLELAYGVVEEIEGIEGEDRFSRFNVNILQSWVEVIGMSYPRF
jgi:hypothetical protein